MNTESTLLAEVDGSIPSVVKSLRKELKSIDLPEGYSINFTRQYHLLTSLATLAVLLPAAIGTPAGSKIFQPFAITLIGGLVAGGAARLVLIPTLLGKKGAHAA